MTQPDIAIAVIESGAALFVAALIAILRTFQDLRALRNRRRLDELERDLEQRLAERRADRARFTERSRKAAATKIHDAYQRDPLLRSRDAA